MKIDLTGQTFNNLKVIKKADEQDGKRTIWDCKCLLCGSKTTATTTQLKSGYKKSCGCIKKKPKAKDLTGQTINYLKVIKRIGTNQHRRPVWRCKCLLCGKYTNELANRIYNDIIRCVEIGIRPREIAKQIKDDFGVSAYQAARLVNTELAKVVSD